MANDLFHNFKPVTDQEWEAVLEKELRGASRADRLVSEAPDGFLIQPYYRRKPVAKNGSAENGGIQSILNRTYGNKWEIRAEIDVIQPDKAIALAEKLMQREVNAIEFRVDSSLSASFRERLTKEGIRSVSNMILRDFPEDKLDIDKPLPKSIQLDLLGSLAKKGNYCKFAEYDWHQLSTHVVGPLRNTRCILVDATIWQNAGATPALELALAIAAGHEYMVKLRSYGVEHTQTCKQLSIRMAAGPDFFSEIAKFRAIRLLWKLVLEPYTPKDRGPFIPMIQGANARWNKSRADRYNNLVRATMESTAAIIGGADSFSVLPHDGIFKIPSSFSRRIADNVQHILKSEVYLDKVADPAAGSWYIESL
ncbi:MAG: methylmalonyl-CoA mutase, partial [Limisphaerales bacterium]